MTRPFVDPGEQTGSGTKRESQRCPETVDMFAEVTAKHEDRKGSTLDKPRAEMARICMFDGPPPRARTTDPDTSHAAAASMESGARTQRALIHAHLMKYGPLTADALDEALFGGHHTAGRRCVELRDIGRLRRQADTRATRAGRQAHLWCAT
ncbi:MAG: hypothetical protein O2992_09650 [Gemmatimonadetes bacterium]|nr:hypothetical protein [Gemmatimonadota bacterium]